MLQDPGAQAAALADVERRAALAIEKVDSRRLGNGVDDRAIDVRRQRGLPRHLSRRYGEDLVAVLACGDAQELPDGIGVAQRAVAGAAGDAVARDQAVQVVARLLGIQAP